MDNTLAEGLQARLHHYEEPANDPGPLDRADWTLLALTGVLLPVVCLLIGWFVGWPA